MNNKVLSVVLVAGIAVTGFAGLSSANEGLLGEGAQSAVNELHGKMHGDHHGKKGFHGHGKRKGKANLTDEEKIALESMSDAERKTFFETKRQEMKEKKETGKLIIDALLAGETLTAAQEATRLEMIAHTSEKEGKHQKPGAEIIAKVLAGDELTVDEETKLTEMKAKHEERQAKRAEKQEPIRIHNLDNGEIIEVE